MIKKIRPDRLFSARLLPVRPALPWRRLSLTRSGLALLGLGLAAMLSGCGSPDPAAPPRPNILLIMTDDMGFGDVGHSGNPYVRTPTLDRLSAAGVQFRNFYVSPVCAPTRASLLTGRYHQRTGVRSVTNGYEIMDPTEYTLAEWLGDAGYRTALFGKWHLGEYFPSLPNAQGFDDYLGFRTGHTADYYDATLERNGRPEATEGYITDVLTDEALDFMGADRDRPFFCYLPYNAPHTPLQVDSALVRPYLDMGLGERSARVYAMVENIDRNVGRLLESLEEDGRLSNTLVIFLSDNGPISGWRVPQEDMRYNAGLRDQKFTVYEGGMRTQCYWWWKGQWPARPERRAVHAVAGHIDVLPTLADLLDLPFPDSIPLDGVSLLPLLDGASDTLADRTFFQKYALETLREPAPFPGGMARRGNWKMVNGEELYNLDHDPSESRNLAQQHPDRLATLRDAYLAWYADLMADQRRARNGIEVGHPEENPVHLQPHHGTASGGLRFTGRRGLLGERIGTHPNGVDGDWLAHWREPEDGVRWEVSVVRAGNYRIGVRVRGEATASPAAFILRAGPRELKGVLLPGLSGSDWQEVSLGTLRLDQGPQGLSLNLQGSLPDNDLAVRALLLERVE